MTIEQAHELYHHEWPVSALGDLLVKLGIIRHRLSRVESQQHKRDRIARAYGANEFTVRMLRVL